MTEQIKKSYNPFKMWGSWVGLLFGIIVSIFSFFLKIETSKISFYEMLILIIAPFIIPYAIIFGCWNPAGADCEQVVAIKTLGIITFLMVSFLIGWLIHSLIRRLKN